jgi:hypothetical protein
MPESKMPRDYFDYTREKLVSFKHQISELLAADFPIPRTRDALIKLSGVFDGQLKRIDSIGIVSADVRKAACAHINVMIKKFLPLLGFVLRSTNVRNSFELADPITRLACHLLSRDVVFVLSSEWEFSPLTYSLSFEELHDVIFLGLPSFESSNALIIPLAGHEFGHGFGERRIPARRSELFSGKIPSMSTEMNGTIFKRRSGTKMWADYRPTQKSKMCSYCLMIQR